MANYTAPTVDTAYLAAQVLAFGAFQYAGLTGAGNLLTALVLVHLCVAVAFIAFCGDMPIQRPPAGWLKRWRSCIRWGRIALVALLIWHGHWATALVLVAAMCCTAAAWHHLERAGRA